MNVNFKVLWFEDEMGWRPSSERSMKKIIESHNLVPIITWKKGDEGDAEEELKKEYDLILMDYELRGTMGNILIKKLRQFDIYTDVVFYSGNYNKMVKALYNIDENPNFLSMSSREKIFDYMGHVHNDRLIPAGLGSGAVFLHKTGDIGKMLGDAGIVYAPNGKKYIVVILANRPYNSPAGKDFIVKASEIIYNNMVY